jgi:formate hydrogenlyase transcriptional activator
MSQHPGMSGATQFTVRNHSSGAATAAKQARTVDADWLLETAKETPFAENRSDQMSGANGRTSKIFGHLGPGTTSAPLDPFMTEQFENTALAQCTPAPRSGQAGSAVELYKSLKLCSDFPIQISSTPYKTEAEQDLLLEFENEERFRRVANTAPLMVWMADTDKQWIFLNNGWLAFTGRTLQEEQAHGWASGVHPEDLQRCLETHCRAFDERAEFKLEYRLRRHDGEYRSVLNHGVPRFESSNVFRGYVGTCLDVTDQKLAEEALLEATDRLAEANFQIAKLSERVESENVYLEREVELEHQHHEVIGDSEGIRRVLQKAEQVAPTDATVLILGETGTGKELIARTIHELSRRKGRLMVKVNCAALPASLVESELFGREKGAFTGALTREIGRFELANCSTILLDEIGELPVELQSKLLRVLQEGEFERLGGPKTIKVDVRVIAATSRNLQQAVREGKFREDLFYRLNVFPITVPPLRDRREDIPPLVWHFVEELSHRMGRSIETIHSSTMDAFKRYPWPGNIRELRNLIERFLITSTNSVFRAELPAVDTDGSQCRPQTYEEVERNHILHTMEIVGWRVRGEDGAARVLGLKPTTLESRMQKLGIVRHK